MYYRKDPHHEEIIVLLLYTTRTQILVIHYFLILDRRPFNMDNYRTLHRIAPKVNIPRQFV